LAVYASLQAAGHYALAYVDTYFVIAVCCRIMFLLSFAFGA